MTHIEEMENRVKILKEEIANMHYELSTRHKLCFQSQAAMAIIMGILACIAINLMN